MLAGLGRDDRRVEREQVGLVADAADHGGDLADLLDAPGQTLERALRVERLRADLLDALDGRHHGGGALLGALAGALGQVSGAAHVLPHLLDRAVHLRDRGGGLLRHLLHLVAVARDVGDAGAHLVDRRGGGLDVLLEHLGAARHLLDGGAHLLDRGGGLLVAARQVLDLVVDALTWLPMLASSDAVSSTAASCSSALRSTSAIARVTSAGRRSTRAVQPGEPRRRA